MLRGEVDARALRVRCVCNALWLEDANLQTLIDSRLVAYYLPIAWPGGVLEAGKFGSQRRCFGVLVFYLHLFAGKKENGPGVS